MRQVASDNKTRLFRLEILLKQNIFLILFPSNYSNKLGLHITCPILKVMCKNKTIYKRLSTDPNYATLSPTNTYLRTNWHTLNSDTTLYRISFSSSQNSSILAFLYLRIP